MAKKSNRVSKQANQRSGKSSKKWDTYEKVAAYVLKQVGKRFNISNVEGKQTVKGKVTDWVIDAKAIHDSGNGFLIVECRRYTKSRLSQEHVASIAFRISDTGATGGITISPHPLQSGAKKVAKAANIQHVQLDPESTPEHWLAEIKKLIIIGVTETAQICISDTLNIEVRDAAGNVIEKRSV